MNFKKIADTSFNRYGYQQHRAICFQMTKKLTNKYKRWNEE